MSTVTKQSATENRQTTPAQTDAYMLDLVKEGYTGAGTHPAVDIPKGFAEIGSFAVVEETVVGPTTVQFKHSTGDAITGAIPVANLVAGDVIPMSPGILTTVTTQAGYAKAAAQTIDLVLLGAGATTAGKIVFYRRIVRVDSAVLNS